MNIDVKHLEYGAVCALMIVLMFIFRDKTPEVHKIKPPEISKLQKIHLRYLQIPFYLVRQMH